MDLNTAIKNKCCTMYNILIYWFQKVGSMNKVKVIKELDRLSGLISKYAYQAHNAWDKGLDRPLRIHGWVVDFDAIKAEHPEIFTEWATAKGSCPSHNGGDYLA